MTMMKAEHTLLAASPERSRLNGEMRRCRSAAPTTSASTIAAPAREATQIAGMPAICCHPSQIARTAPSDAPAEIPSV